MSKVFGLIKPLPTAARVLFAGRRSTKPISWAAEAGGSGPGPPLFLGEKGERRGKERQNIGQNIGQNLMFPTKNTKIFGSLRSLSFITFSYMFLFLHFTNMTTVSLLERSNIITIYEHKWTKKMMFSNKNWLFPI